MSIHAARNWPGGLTVEAVKSEDVDLDPPVAVMPHAHRDN